MSGSSLTPEELRAWYAFLQSHHRVMHRLDAELVTEHGLPLASYEVLMWLSQAPGRAMKMVDLARVVMLSPSGLTRLLDRLVRDGLVERIPSRSDARVMLAHLTAEGATRLRESARTHVRGIREHFLSGLGPAQLAALADALDSVSQGTQCPGPPAQVLAPELDHV